MINNDEVLFQCALCGRDDLTQNDTSMYKGLPVCYDCLKSLSEHRDVYANHELQHQNGVGLVAMTREQMEYVLRCIRDDMSTDASFSGLSMADNLAISLQEAMFLTHSDYEAIPAPFIFVSVYTVSREYGGAEEGGWWYDHYTLNRTDGFSDYAEAVDLAQELAKEWENGEEEARYLPDVEELERAFTCTPAEREPGAAAHTHLSTVFHNGGSYPQDDKYLIMFELQPGSYATTHKPIWC